MQYAALFRPTSLLGDEQTSVDPTRVLQLVQAKPKAFKLDGGDRLRFFHDLSDPAKRAEQVGAIIRQVTG